METETLTKDLTAKAHPPVGGRFASGTPDRSSAAGNLRNVRSRAPLVGMKAVDGRTR
jgi:hypothetical protein